MNALPIHLSRYAVLALFTLSVGCGASASVNVEESTGQARGAVETTPLLPAGAIALLTVSVNLVVDWMLHKASGLKE